MRRLTSFIAGVTLNFAEINTAQVGQKGPEKKTKNKLSSAAFFVDFYASDVYMTLLSGRLCVNSIVSKIKQKFPKRVFDKQRLTKEKKRTQLDRST